MAHEEWKRARLENFASIYIINEHAMKNRIFIKCGKDNVCEAAGRNFPWQWREFRNKLFAEIRQSMRKVVDEGEHPAKTFDNVSLPLYKIVHRYDLLKLALQAEVSALDSPMCTWAVRRLVRQLGRVASLHCFKSGHAPRSLPARALAPAVHSLQALGAAVKCTRAQLVDIWQRLCSLKTWQLYRLMRAGDRQLLVPPAERLDAADWTLLDALLLHDDEERMQLVTMPMLEYVECYRALVVLVRLLAVTPGAQPLPTRGRAAQLLWSRVHARYSATGRKVSIVLLQRRWHQLRSLARDPPAAPAPPAAPRHPLLQLVTARYRGGPLSKDCRDTWSEVVHSERCVLADDDNAWKQEEKRHWYVDFTELEKLRTVNEINDYILRRLHYTEGKYNCGFWEHNHCSLSHSYGSNLSVAYQPHNTGDSTNDTNEQNNTDTCTKESDANEPATIEALERLDPNSAQVTVVVEDDFDETLVLDTDVEMKNNTQSLLKDSVINAENDKQNTRDVSTDVLDVAKDVDSRNELRISTNKQSHTEEKSHWFGKDFSFVSSRSVHCWNGGAGQLTNTIVKSKEPSINKANTGIAEEGNLKQEPVDEDEESDLNELQIDCKSDSDEATCTAIDSKLLCLTRVTLVRIDETLSWLKYARGNTIDVRRAGFLKRKRDVAASNVYITAKMKLDKRRISDGSQHGDHQFNSDGNIWKVQNFNSEIDDSEFVYEDHKNKTLVKFGEPAAERWRRASEDEGEGESSRGGRVVKRVELPDIDEVRRINRNILTAQVRPIPLDGQSEDAACNEVAGSSSGSKVMSLATELAILDRDMRTLFAMTPEELEAVINEAVNSDEDKNQKMTTGWDYKDCEVVKLTAPANVFLDEADDDEVTNHHDEPPKKKRKAKKKKKTTQTSDTEEPIRLNAYEEWERQKQIANKYFEIGTKNKGSKNRNAVESKSNHAAIPARPSTDPDIKAQEYEDTKEFQNIAPRLSGLAIKRERDDSFVNVLPGAVLTRSSELSVEKRVDQNVKYMVVSPMDTTKHVMKVEADDDGYSIPVVDSDEPDTTPVITGVCSLADTETIDDADAGPTARVTTDRPSGDHRPLTISLSPKRRKITVKVGNQLVCKSRPNVLKVKVSTTPKGSEGDVTPGGSIFDKCKKPEPQSPRQSFLQQLLSREPQPLHHNPDLKTVMFTTPEPANKRIESAERRQRRKRQRKERAEPGGTPTVRRRSRRSENASRRRCRRPRPQPDVVPELHAPNELTGEHTTAEQYVQSDSRPLLTVAKLDLDRPVWAIENQYVLLTDLNLPCRRPGYWTVGRVPPGPCQLIRWLNEHTSESSTSEESNRSTDHTESTNDLDIDADANDVLESDEGRAGRESNVPNLSGRSHDDVAKTEARSVDVNCHRINNIESLNTDDREPSSDEQDSSEARPNNVDIINRMINHSRDRTDDDVNSDSDSESNELQIVEEDEPPVPCVKADFNETDSAEYNSDDELTRSHSNGGRGIKVKSFASIGHLAGELVNPDVLENDNKFYKKLLDPPIESAAVPGGPTYAVMVSVVSSAEQCDRLLREGAPLQVLERYRGLVYPLDVSTRDLGAVIRVRHYDAAFLDDLARKIRTCSDASPLRPKRTYVFSPFC